MSQAPSVFEQFESNVRSYSRSFPAIFQRARGSVIYDTSGKEYLDFFSGAGTLNYGHNEERMKRRLISYLESDGIIHALDASTTAKQEFLTRFRDVVLQPRGLDYKVQFCGPTGTNAVEAALKLARKVTKRTGVFAFSGGYHGMSLGSMSVTSGRSVRASAGVPTAHTTFIPYPVGPRGNFDSLSYLRNLLEDSHSGVDVPAAMILETVQMDGGIYIASAEWLKELRTLCDQHGILLICDDIQAGCGRTGRFFSFERAGIQPDLVTLSKSISGYGLPMALLLMRRDLDQWKPGEHTGTFRGLQLSFIAATEALGYWQEPAFEKSIKNKEQLLRGVFGDALPGLEGELDLRGIGMAFGIDMIKAGGYERARRIQQRAFQHGLIMEQCGREDTVLKVMPPLTTTEEQLMKGCEILIDSIRHA
ncbi:diaminobutyrate--2-oxoglutarate transaminase [Hyalangium rubrum]|uniref:Diaminobutyrate--2-oxoglutarate transaminase n=1 Tax=Hyalangium rubrum TaxID=3103134 RepID=A0ABU5GVA6_9BACT|nr:diaminobutyrate--2-oxoglutarate transaminase [Hyalangium sp. s54d21]MDY7225113.1 diaminobutyrate--2-oxoglutarate transaminase [Hyalangium sp. s54d21]